MKSCVPARGFTLLELLISVSILVFLGGAVFAVFYQGMAVWNRASQEKGDMEVELSIEKLTSDLRNAFVYGNLTFSGSPDSVEFNSLGPNKIISEDNPAASEIAPIRVRYFFNRKAKAFDRTEADYRRILDSKESVVDSREARSLVDHVTECRFGYYDSKKDVSERWVSRWRNICLPAALKIYLEYEEKGFSRNLSRVVMIPTTACKENGP